MTVRRTLQRVAVASALMFAPLLAPPSAAHAADMPPACQAAVTKAQEAFPVQYFTVPDKVKSALLDELSTLSEADQQQLTEPACTAWNKWAAANGKAVAADLDAWYQKADGLACSKFATSAIGALKKYAPAVPAATRPLETVAKKAWQRAMQNVVDQATNASCRQAYNNVKSGW